MAQTEHVHNFFYYLLKQQNWAQITRKRLIYHKAKTGVDFCVVSDMKMKYSGLIFCKT